MSFDNTGESILTVFQILTNDAFVIVAADLVRASGSVSHLTISLSLSLSLSLQEELLSRVISYYQGLLGYICDV